MSQLFIFFILLGRFFLLSYGGATITISTQVSTVVGRAGLSGTSGNGGPAASALISNPIGVHIDTVGQLFFIQSSFVRKVSTDGIISLFAGSG